MLVRLNRTYCGDSDLKCPHCAAELDVEWLTEYGDPIQGDKEERCPECSKDIQFYVETITTYHVKEC